jgi:hypothetical protein
MNFKQGKEDKIGYTYSSDMKKERNAQNFGVETFREATVMMMQKEM